MLDIWDEYAIECLECGLEFFPDEPGQECCSNKCSALRYSWTDNDWIDEETYDEETEL